MAVTGRLFRGQAPKVGHARALIVGPELSELLESTGVLGPVPN